MNSNSQNSNLDVVGIGIGPFNISLAALLRKVQGVNAC